MDEWAVFTLLLLLGFKWLWNSSTPGASLQCCKLSPGRLRDITAICWLCGRGWVLLWIWLKWLLSGCALSGSMSESQIYKVSLNMSWRSPSLQRKPLVMSRREKYLHPRPFLGEEHFVLLGYQSNTYDKREEAVLLRLENLLTLGFLIKGRRNKD